MKKLLLIFVLMAPLVAGGCRPPSTVLGQKTNTVSGANTNVPQLSPANPPTLPAAKPGLGVVVGRLVQEASGAAIASQLIYLGDYIPVTPGPGELITMQVQSSPSTTTDGQGYFAFNDVAPGDYPLIVWTPFSSKVVANEAGDKALNIVVIADQVTRLGEVKAQWP